MSYSVKYSTTDAQANLSPLDKKLRSIPSAESLITVEKVCRNVYAKGDQEKYRSLRLANAKIKELLVDVPGCMDSLFDIGWQVAGENKDLLTFEGKMPFSTLRSITEAIDVRKREDEKQMMRKVAKKSKVAGAAAESKA